MIFIDDVTWVVKKLIENPAIKGVYNLCGKEPISRKDFALKFARNWGFKENLIIPMTMDDVVQEAARPKNCGMNISKLKESIGFNPTSIEDALKIMKENNPHPPLIK
jgi:nucleoside-diphosphate-sugar epimerase